MKALLRVLGWFVWAFVLLKGWSWFVVPLGVSAITFWHALGLGMISNCFWPDRSEKQAEELRDSSLAHVVTISLVNPMFLLLWLWLVSFGMP